MDGLPETVEVVVYQAYKEKRTQKVPLLGNPHLIQVVIEICGMESVEVTEKVERNNVLGLFPPALLPSTLLAFFPFPLGGVPRIRDHFWYLPCRGYRQVEPILKMMLTYCRPLIGQSIVPGARFPSPCHLMLHTVV